MRVIGGCAKGRTLKSARGLRPTSDEVKEALFNILGERIKGIQFLDLFAGTGNVGIEALSRGAQRVVLVESSPLYFKTIQENLTLTGLKEQAEVYLLSVKKVLSLLARGGRKFGVVFLDPPYNYPIETILDLLSFLSLEGEGGIVIAQHGGRKNLKDKYGRLTRVMKRGYGDTALSFFERAPG